MKYNFSHISKPQLARSDALYALWYLLRASSQSKKGSRMLEESLRNFLGVTYAFSFNAARSALYVLLQSIGVEKGDEVLLQAFTHVSVPNSILWNNARPVYVDISPSTYNMNYKDLEKKITKKTKAIIVQHTYGLPADMGIVMDIAKKHKLFVIEDAAHSLGARYKDGRLVGTQGDAAIFSFGSTKVIDAASGGVVVTNNSHIAKSIQRLYKSLTLPRVSWTKGQLLYLTGSFFLKPIHLGFLLFMKLREKKIIPRMTTPEEKIGKQPPVYPALLPDALARLIKRQFIKVEEYNDHRQQVALWYKEKLSQLPIKLPREQKGRIYLRYAVQTPKAEEVIKEALRLHLDLTRMFGNLIGPADTQLDKIGYRVGSCPMAEKVARQCLELPTGTYVREEDVRAIGKLLKKVTTSHK